MTDENPTADPSDKVRLLALWISSVVAGSVAALVVVGFRRSIVMVEWLSTGQVGGLVHAATNLQPWQRVVVPTVGGLIAGIVLDLGARLAGSKPHLDYIDAARQGTVDLNDRTTSARAVSALVSVGTGSSIGREGPMVQVSAWLASILARALPMDRQQRSAVLVCGIAGGIAAAYHAPVAGVVFILELALGFLARHLAAPVLVATVASSALIRYLLGPDPLFPMPRAQWPAEVVWVALIAGAVFGLVGLGLLAMLDYARQGFRRIVGLPARLALGGLIVGLVSTQVPQVWGNGYSVVAAWLQQGAVIGTVCVVLAAKLVAMAASAGSGAVGGVFTPTLFVGAAVGFVMADALPLLHCSAVIDPSAFAVTGMAAVLAGVTHAPMMAIVIALETTGQYQLVLPVMLASAVAYAISARFGVTPLYGNPIEVPGPADRLMRQKSSGDRAS